MAEDSTCGADLATRSDEDEVTITARALEMKLRLKRLMRDHGVSPEPINIPLTAPTAHPMILEGYAATTDLDLDRTKLRAFAFGYPLPKSCRDVPLAVET